MLGFEGETTDITPDNCRSVIQKFGAMTGRTEGFFTGRIHQCSYKCHGDVTLVLCNQITVSMKRYDQNMQLVDPPGVFASFGDSGSLVLIEDGNTSKAVGILTAHHTDGLYIVTPIQPICEDLGHDGWNIPGIRNEEPMDVGQC